MFGRGIHLCTMFGFKVEIDLSWLIIAVLVTWSLAVGHFPLLYPDLTPATYWWMGVIGALGLFTSIVLHELSHSLVARRYGLEMRGIRLFVFGGVAQMDNEPTTPKAEFMMAIAGPIASVAISAVAYGLYRLGVASQWTIPARGVLFYLAWINAVLVVFNLIPAFPLDGGRILRSALWRIKGNLKWATRIAAGSGSVFAFVLMVLGLLSLLNGGFIGGMWFILLGLFLRGAAASSYQQMLVSQVLGGESVERLMQPEIQTVSPSITIQELVDDHIYRYHYKMFPVTENGHLLGCISTRQLRDLPRDQWTQSTVGDLVEPCTEENTISPDADAMQAFKRMNQGGRSRLAVVEDGRLRGMISLKEVSRLIALKLELEE